VIKTLIKRLFLYSLFAISLVAISSYVVNHSLNAQATESLKAELKFEKEKNSFNVKINTQDKVDYVLTYRTDKQTEAIKGSSDENQKKDFQKSIINMPLRDHEPITKDFSEPAIALSYLRLFQSHLPIKAGQIVLS